jgi:hypothetical protein
MNEVTKCDLKREDIIRMAREAWLMDKHDCSDDLFVRADIDEKNIFEFAALVAAAEREACAAIADKEIGNTMMLMSQPPKSSAAWNIANAIRARGEA